MTECYVFDVEYYSRTNADEVLKGTIWRWGKSEHSARRQVVQSILDSLYFVKRIKLISKSSNPPSTLDFSNLPK